MSTLVGIVNRHGAAIAADSAATYGYEWNQKVINNADKIFELSDFHPMAIMVYGSASFMGLDWEMIIKEYRRELGDKGFAEAINYVYNFVNFLHKKDFFCDAETKMEVLRQMLTYYFYSVDEVGEIIKKYRAQEISEEEKDRYIEDMLQRNIELCKGVPNCPELDKYEYEEFCNYAKKMIDGFAKDNEVKCKDLLAETFYQFLIKIFDLEFCSGLVFVGYGEKEIFPSIITMRVSIVVEKHLRFYFQYNECAHISEHEQQSCIIPFAQDDVIRTMIDGFHPALAGVWHSELVSAIECYSSQMEKILEKGEENKEFAEAIKGIDIDAIVDKHCSRIQECAKKNHTRQIVGVVSNLDIQSMANFARSLVSLTADIRKVQNGQETVGGPIDVATISKGDGFIWINKKSYIKPELNPNYLARHHNQ